MATSNFTEEMVVRLREVYDPSASESVRGEQIKLLADEFDLTTRHVIGKLTTEKNEDGESLYVPKARTATEPKAHVETRAEVTASIAEALGMQASELASLTRANLVEITALRDHLVD